MAIDNPTKYVTVSKVGNDVLARRITGPFGLRKDCSDTYWLGVSLVHLGCVTIAVIRIGQAYHWSFWIA